MPRNRRETEIRERKIRIGVVTSCAVLGLLSIIACGYGHAAFSSDLMISGEAKILENASTFDAVYMQDLTPQECASKANDTTSQLIDKRDGKKYWVAKIGSQCMMVQDLRLDLSAETELTSELSDINYSSTAGYEEEEKNGQIIYKWNANSKYPPVETYTWLANTGLSWTTTRSWNLGEYVMVNASIVTACTYRYGLDGCPNQVFNVGEVWETDDNGQEIKVRDAFNPTWNYASTGETYNEGQMSYDAHYLLGNYYQFMTATAGSAVKAAKRVAPSSICPSGWQLPPTIPSNDLRIALEEYAGTTVNKDLLPYIAGVPFYSTNGGIIQSTTLMTVGGNSYLLTNTFQTTAYMAVLASNIAMNATTNQPHYAFQVRCMLRFPEEE